MRVDRDAVVVITGASGGVGRATARLLGERGARVVLVARGRDGLAAAKREVEERGGRALAVPGDVSRFADLEAAADAAEREFGPIDLWINNAMVSMYSPFTRMTTEEFQHIVEVTFLGTVHGTRVALQRMIPADRGVIIQVGSALAFRSIPLQSAYCASKHAIQGFTESIRSELIHDRSSVRVSGRQHARAEHHAVCLDEEQDASRGASDRHDLPAGGCRRCHPVCRRARATGDDGRLHHGRGDARRKGRPGAARSLSRRPRRGKDRCCPTGRSDRPDNFWKPVPGDHGAHGQFDSLARGFSIQLWATKHRAALLSGLLVAGAAWATSRAQRSVAQRSV